MIKNKINNIPYKIFYIPMSGSGIREYELNDTEKQKWLEVVGSEYKLFEEEELLNNLNKIKNG